MRLADVLGDVVGRLGAGRSAATVAVVTNWADLVGPALAAHTRPVRVVDGVLHVACDHAAWAAEVRRLTPELLVQLHERVGEGAIGSVAVRVRPPGPAEPHERSGG